ncbi:MAG: hypothetical protein FGM32_01125 [Candidatus Kapabacteria bacterium]|nr:hypothetical protein [Candidatus Kapabacteria bacterium]
MKFINAIQRFVLVTVAVLSSALSLTAQTQYPSPTGLTATYTASSNGLSGYVVLSWNGIADYTPLPGKYSVHQASGITEDMSKFAMIGTVLHNAGNRENRYSFTIQTIKSGTYTFYVRGLWTNGEGPRSAIVTLEVKTPDAPVIRFVSVPVTSGFVGKAYEYQTKIETSATGPVTYKLVSGPDGMTITDGGKLVWNEPRVGRYEIVITAYVTKDGKTYDVRQSYVLTVTDGAEQVLKFLTEPIKSGTAGIRYAYQARAGVVNGNVMPTYSIVVAPQGMVIDAKTGLLMWENPAVGKYDVVIAAKATINGVETIVKQSFALEIKEGKPSEKGCATITGVVTFDDPTSTAKLEGVVTAWRQEVVKKDNGSSSSVYRPIYKGEINNGVYTISLPEGTYKLRIEGKTFYSEWHADALELADAKDVVVACNTTEKVDFSVKVRPEPVLVVAEGRVFDAVTNEPVKAVVVFECRSKEVGSVDDRYRVVNAETRTDGTYEIKIQAGVNYTAMVRVIPTRDNANAQYLAEFWNNTNDATQATVINVTSNIKDVNFPMDKRQPRNNGFGGTMMNHYTSAPVTGKVVAYRFATRVGEKGDTIMTKAGAFTVETNSNGGYLFADMEPGEYIVMGMPSGRPFIPGWMVMGQMAAKEWKGAQRVSVGDVMLAVQYDIRLDTVKGEKGKGRVRGFVFDKSGGIVKKDGDKVESSNGVVGTLVIARDENGDVVDFAMTENDGAFELSEMAIGTSTIVADRLEFEPTTQMVTLDPTTTERVISIGLQTNKSTTGVDVPLNEIGATLNLWPNPTTGSASVRFDAKAGEVMVRIVSTTGAELASIATVVAGGDVSIALPTAELPTGMVMVHVTNGSKAFALPLNIVR